MAPSLLWAFVPGEFDHLLEGRTVGPAHRKARDDPRREFDADLGRLPFRRVRSLDRGHAFDGFLDRRPQRFAAGFQVAVAAVAATERPGDRLAENRPQVLGDV